MEQESEEKMSLKLTKQEKKNDIFTQTQTLNKKILELPKVLQVGILSVITTLKSFSPTIPLKKASQLIQSISDTVKKATQPQINSFKFDTGHNANLYPIFGIIAWKNQQLGYPAIDWRVCSFVESGGVRCVPIIECNLDDEKNLNSLKNQIQNIHGLIIPEFYQLNSTLFLQKVFNIIRDHDKQLFVFSFGNSSNFLLSQKYKNLCKSTKSKSGLVEGRFVNVFQSDLLSDINITLKLKILSQSISYPLKSLPQINLAELNNLSESIEVESYMITNQKDSAILPWLIRQTISPKFKLYHSFIEMYDQSCTKGIQYFNKGIINFVNMTKEKLYNVKNPSKYVAHYPLEFKESAEKAHYKIASNPATK